MEWYPSPWHQQQLVCSSKERGDTLGVLCKVHGAIRDISNVKNIVNSVQYLLFINGKSALDIIYIMVFQHNYYGQG